MFGNSVISSSQENPEIKIHLTFQFLYKLGKFMIKHHVVWARKTRLWFLSSSGIKFMFANEAKLLNKVLPANPLLNQLFQFLSKKRREKSTTVQHLKKKTFLAHRITQIGKDL